MRLGLIVRADNGGLGSQTLELYRWLRPAKTLVVDISGYNKQWGQYGYDNHFERFTDGDVTISTNFPNNSQIDAFLDDVDVVFTVESPYTHYLFEAARARGVKTVQQYNYEFLDYFIHPDWPKPDLLLAPSMWHYAEVAEKAEEWGCQIKYLPVPTNRTIFPYRQRTQAKKFLHIAGHNTYEDRNGTQLVLETIPFVKADVEFTIRSQYEIPALVDDYRVKVIVGDAPNYWESYNEEDVTILPRRYGGLSLQLNEAMSLGMIPIMTDIEPQNGFLHPDSLVPAEMYMSIAPRTPIDVYRCTPQDLAARIDWLAAQPEEKIKELSEHSNKTVVGWAEAVPLYEQALWDLLKS